MRNLNGIQRYAFVYEVVICCNFGVLHTGFVRNVKVQNCRDRLEKDGKMQKLLEEFNNKYARAELREVEMGCIHWACTLLSDLSLRATELLFARKLLSQRSIPPRLIHPMLPPAKRGRNRVDKLEDILH